MHEPHPSPIFSVSGRHVLITGGTGGIGRMLAGAFLGAGAIVTITGRKASALERARAEFGGAGELHTIEGDLSGAEGTSAIARAYADSGRPLDVLINNAGRAWGAPLESFPEAEWPSVFAVNVQAPFVLVQKLLPLLKASASDEEPSRVINIGSVYAIMTDVMHAYSYSASKAALHQVTRLLARELAPYRVLVNAIAPGFFPSKMTEFAMKDPERRRQLVASIPLGRHGTPEDIGGLALFLSSRASSFITGSIIPLDGGILAQH